MKILAIETATIEVGVAIGNETGPLATLTARPGRRQAETLASRHRRRVPDSPGLSRRARCRRCRRRPGPVHRAPCRRRCRQGARGRPRPAARDCHEPRGSRARARPRPGMVVPVIDMRRGEVAWQCFRRSPARCELGRGRLSLLAELEDLGAPVLFVGDGALRHREELAGHLSAPAVFGGIELAAPPVASLVVLAVKAMEQGSSPSPRRCARFMAVKPMPASTGARAMAARR